MAPKARAGAGAAAQRPVVQRRLGDDGRGAREIGERETDLLGDRQQQQVEDAEREADQAVLRDMRARAGRHLEQQAGHEGEADEHDAVLDRPIGLAIGVDRRQQGDAEGRRRSGPSSGRRVVAQLALSQSWPYGRPRCEADQRARKPSLSTVWLTGRRPVKLGAGQGDDSVASVRRPSGTRPSLPLPARVRLKRTETVSRPSSASVPRLRLERRQHAARRRASSRPSGRRPRPWRPRSSAHVAEADLQASGRPVGAAAVRRHARAARRSGTRPRRRAWRCRR